MLTNALAVMTAELENEPTSRSFSVNDGDCGLVIRKDGTVELFQQGMDTAALQNPHSLLSVDDKQAMKNGELLMVLSIVAATKELQETILSLAVSEGTAEVPAANANGK